MTEEGARDNAHSGVVPLPSLVMLVGPSGAGKSHWAEAIFLAGEVVSSDRLRAAVGRSEHDQDASEDAFAVLDLIVSRRLARRLTVVVDTLGLDPQLRARMLAAARQAGVTAVAVLFDTSADACRERNRLRPVPVPAPVLSSQVRRYREQRMSVLAEGWDLVIPVEQVAVVSERPAESRRAIAAGRQESGVRFGLVVSSFPWKDGQIAQGLAEVAVAAEEAGFAGLWLMDHLIQIPQVGRRWDPMLEGPTALAWLAARTERIELGTLVANSSLRNPAHLAKIFATIDVLSDGRARCGLGAGWWEDELDAYGLPFPIPRDRVDRLEDALRLLPMMWGPGVVDFTGKTVTVTGAECYPRPLRGTIPILVGGQGHRTLALAACHADGVNLRGGDERVEAAVSTLDRHLEAVGRDRGEFGVTHLSWPLVGRDRPQVSTLRERYRRGEGFTTGEMVGRVTTLLERGVDGVFFAPPDLAEGSTAVERYARVTEAFR